MKNVNLDAVAAGLMVDIGPHERDRLQAVNATLLAALERLERAEADITQKPGETADEMVDRYTSEREAARKQARAAIAAAQEG